MITPKAMQNPEPKKIPLFRRDNSNQTSIHAQDTTEFNMATLQQQVRQHLDNTGISLRELARRSGISHQAIGKILRGGEYKNDTAKALIEAMQPQTLDATIEQLAAQCIDSDLTHVRDTDLECAKYRRVMQLEKELEQTQDLLKQREQHLKSCENALIEADEKIGKQDAWIEIVDDARKELQRLLSEEQSEVKRLTAQITKAEALTQVYSKDLQTMQASWKAASVQVEQLQKQLEQSQVLYSKLCSRLGATRTNYETQLEAANQKESRLQEQLTEVYAEKTRQEAQIMRLRGCVWILIAALVFVVVSGLVVWGGV